jgi:glucosamine-6-phosphate deaminase
MGPILKSKVDLLEVKVFFSREEMGAAAGKDAVECITKLLKQQDVVRIVFAAAPSQNELLRHLSIDTTIDWQRIDVFHMDEYMGLPTGAPQRFSSFLLKHLFQKVAPRRVHLIDDTEGQEAARLSYKTLLQQATLDIVCLGIGENGHLAFNDPPDAKFDDTEIIKVVTLDEVCRQQQVNDGCFARLEEVPKEALTLTIPILLSGKYLFCTVPGNRKSTAVKNMLTGDVTTACPASILRRHPNCMMYTDKEAYSQMPLKRFNDADH